MSKLRLRKNGGIKSGYIFLLTLIFVFFITYFFIYSISEVLTPTLIEMAEIKINKYSTAIINNAVSQVLEDKIDTLDVVEIQRDEKGNIQIVDFNPVVVNHILNVATTVVQNNIRRLEDGDVESIGIGNVNLSDEEMYNLKNGILATVPMGRASNITLLSNMGPLIPVRFHYIGDINSNIETKVTEYGINNALIEIGLNLEVTAQIILPFSTEEKVLTNYVPIVIKMVQGDIPNYYSDRLNSNSYSLPAQ